MKTFKQKKGQLQQKRDALCFALNEHLNDFRMLAEFEVQMSAPGWDDQPTYSTEHLMNEFRRSYVGRFRTKRLRKKHADLVKPIW